MRTECDIQKEIDYHKRWLDQDKATIERLENELKEIQNKVKTYRIGDWFKRPGNRYYMLAGDWINHQFMVGLMNMEGEATYKIISVQNHLKITQEEFEQLWLPGSGIPVPCDRPF